MTTVPLSLCYGALNLLVLADTSNFVPCVCDRAIAGGGGVRGPGKHPTVVRYFRWWRGSGTVVPYSVVSCTCCSHFWVRLALGPNTCSISFLSIIVPIPSFLCPLYRPKFHLSSPKRRSQRSVVVLRAQTDISLVNKRIS